MSKSFDRSSQGWRDRARDFRNRMLASPRFQDWVAGFPLTRRFAQRRAAQLFNTINGFVYSQTMVACVELDLFERLRCGPQSVAALAAACDLPEPAMLRLLKAGATLALIEPAGAGRYALGEMGAAMLGNAAVLPMIRHHALLYADLADPVALLRHGARDGALARYWPYAANGTPAAVEPAATRGYSALMADSQPMVALQVLDAYPLQRHRVLLDVGGGEGAFLIAAAARVPALELRLFDLPPVAERARSRLAEAGLSDRAATTGGDMFADTWPAGADVVSLVRVLHDHDDAAALALLRRAHAALPPGGVLLIAEPMAGTPHAEAMGDAYFGFYLLAMGSGRPRTVSEIAMMLRAAGFRRIRVMPTRTPLITQLITATC